MAMSFDLSTGDEFLDKLTKAKYVPHEDPYGDLFDWMWWEEQMPIIATVSLGVFLLAYGIPYFDSKYYLLVDENGVPPSKRFPSFARGNLSVRQWSCECFLVGAAIFSVFLWYGFLGDTFNYMMCVKDPGNLTVGASCASRMCDWQRELQAGAKVRDGVNCLVIRHSMFRTVKTSLLELKDPEQVAWDKEKRNRSDVYNGTTRYTRTKALFNVYVTGENEKGETIRVDLYSTLHPWRDDTIASPLNDTREAVRTFLNADNQEDDMQWQGSMGFLWGDLHFRSDSSRFDLRRLRQDTFIAMVYLTVGFLMCCGVHFCETFTFDAQSGKLHRRRYTGLIYPDEASLGLIENIKTFKAHESTDPWCCWRRQTFLSFTLGTNPRATMLRELGRNAEQTDEMVKQCNSWLEDWKAAKQQDRPDLGRK